MIRFTSKKQKKSAMATDEDDRQIEWPTMEL